MITPQNSQSPYKRRYSSSSASSSTKRRRTTKTNHRRVWSTKRRRPYGRIRWNRKKKLNISSSSKTINVAEDKELFNKIKRKQIVTRKQQKIINKRFKEGYSPFQINIDSQFQLTSGDYHNSYKYIWRNGIGLNDIIDYFKAYPYEYNTPGAQLANSGYYIKSSEQSIYINDVTMEYKILNPTNYDMFVEVYDIVYKDDSYLPVVDTYLEKDTDKVNLVDQDPIALCIKGKDSLTDGTYTNVADTQDIFIENLTYKPTMSYPFNIYCNIVKKQIFLLQPGATMTHVFKWKPKALINLGYLYKYDKYVKDSNNPNIALKNITSGSMFRFYGKLATTGSNSDKNQVASLPGRLSIKQFKKVKYYAMSQRFNYIKENKTAVWFPDNDTEASKMEVVNDVTIKPNQEQNIVPTDNTNTSEQTQP